MTLLISAIRAITMADSIAENGILQHLKAFVKTVRSCLRVRSEEIDNLAADALKRSYVRHEIRKLRHGPSLSCN